MSENLVENTGARNAIRRRIATSIARWSFGTGAKYDQTPPRLLGIFAAWRLRAYGYTLAIIYAAILIIWYKAGIWLVDRNGVPLLDTDFKGFWLIGTQALHGDVTPIYDPAQFKHLMAALVGPEHAKDLFLNFPYPPIIFLIMAPLGLLPFVSAFWTWEAVTLLGCIAVVFLIVRRSPAIALVLASPFGAFDIRWGHTGFLRASLLGAALLALEPRPVLAGVFIGWLTYKPQFGILIPVALIAGKQWRAFFSAVMTTAFLVGVSIAAFGIDPWIAFPRGFLGNANDILLQESHRKTTWMGIQTIYGLVRAFHGSAALGWSAQVCVTVGIAIVVWLVWLSTTRYALKAAVLSASTLIATPFAWFHDLTVIAIPVAFLAKDQMDRGLLRGEQTIMLALFGTALAILVCGGGLPLGPVIVIALLGVILRRVFRDGGETQPAKPSQSRLRTARRPAS